MNTIKTEKDVLGWAQTIVDGKGEKFIPLSKADMFAIAEFVLTYSPSEPLEAVPPAPVEPSQQAEDPQKVEQAESCTTSTIEDRPPTTKATMTRGYALHRAGFTSQQAFDKFLEWRKEHSAEGKVMDFSTGQKSTDAAFAYWLMEIIEVDIPAHVR